MSPSISNTDTTRSSAWPMPSMRPESSSKSGAFIAFTWLVDMAKLCSESTFQSEIVLDSQPARGFQ